MLSSHLFESRHNIRLSYLQAYICEGDVFMVMDQFDAAEESYSSALDLDPSIRRSKSFKVLSAFTFFEVSPRWQQFFAKWHISHLAILVSQVLRFCGLFSFSTDVHRVTCFIMA